MLLWVARIRLSLLPRHRVRNPGPSSSYSAELGRTFLRVDARSAHRRLRIRAQRSRGRALVRAILAAVCRVCACVH